jgi:tetratricopeptide (TPR) repeat protein
MAWARSRFNKLFSPVVCKKNTMKILHLPELVGGHPTALSDAEKKLGFDSSVLTLYSNYLQYKSDISLNLTGKNKLYRFIKHFETFLKYRKGYDIYHFNFGSSLLHFPSLNLPLLDLPFYEKGKKIFFTYQGCDIRQKYPTIQRHSKIGCHNAACFQQSCYGGICNSGKRDIFRKKAAEKAYKYADHIFVLNPDLLYFLPTEKVSFLPYCIHNYFKIKEKEGPFFQNDVFRIVHSPTQRDVKGTEFILRALYKLKDIFKDKLEIILVENRSHQEALEIYQKADLFIDQILIGWYGAVSVEVMKMGIPVACFINPEHLALVQNEFKDPLPFINVNQFDIYDKLKNIIENRDVILELSKQSLKFVHDYHNPIDIAKRISLYY